MSRLSFRVVFAMCLLSFPVQLHAADPEERRVDEKQQKEVNAAANEQLDRKLPEINFKENMLADVTDFLRDVTGANIFVNWKALDAVKITKETDVTVRLQNVKFAKALQVILDAAAGGEKKLGFIVDEGVITVSTVDDLNMRSETRAYDVRFALVAKDAGNDAAARDKRVEALMKLVTGSVDVASWHDAGGKVGAIKELSGQLIVTQTKQNHEAVANLVEQLRILMTSENEKK